MALQGYVPVRVHQLPPLVTGQRHLHLGLHLRHVVGQTLPDTFGSECHAPPPVGICHPPQAVWHADMHVDLCAALGQGIRGHAGGSGAEDRHRHHRCIGAQREVGHLMPHPGHRPI